MTFKPKQLDPKAVKTFSETEVGTPLENIDDKLGLILESQNGIRDDIKTLKNDSRRIDDRVSKT